MRILGIDLGTSSVKAVEIDSAFGRFDIRDYHERAVEANSTPRQTAAALVKSLAKQPDRMISCLGASSVTFRNLQLPTRDKKAIQAGVGFELEDELPFSSEESIYDYAVINQTKQGSTVHISATLKRHISDSIAVWKESGIDLDILSTHTWAYRNLINRVIPPADQEIPILFIQIGHESTLFYVQWKGTPTLLRELLWGGKDLTQAISDKFQIPFIQAEAMKIERGIILPSQNDENQNPEQVNLSDCLKSALAPLINELKQVEITTKNSTHLGISSLYFSGGTSLLQGINPWIESHFRVPVKTLKALSVITPSGVTYSDQTDAKFALAVSLALCLVGSDRALCINFRKGDFAKEGKTKEFDFKALTKPLIAAGTVMTCLILSLIVQSTVYRSRLVSTDIQLEKSIKLFFGQMSSSALRTYMANTSTLKNAVNKELNKQREINRLYGQNPKSPLDFLNSLSTGIPKNVVLDMTQFQVGSPASDSYIGAESSQTASLAFLVANPQVGEKLASLLGNKIVNPQRGKMEEVPSTDETGNRWKITFSGKPTEDAYGK